MSDKNLDEHGRHRSKTVAFRMSPEEARMLDCRAKVSGMTKQEYIISKLNDRTIEVIPSSRMQKHMEEPELQMRDCYWHLVDEATEEELEERLIPDCVLMVLEFMPERGSEPWQGSMKELIQEIGLEDLSALRLEQVHGAAQRLHVRVRDSLFEEARQGRAGDNPCADTR